MSETPKPVFGVHAPPAKPTVSGAFWLAAIVSVPVGLLGLAVELIWRWAF